jgi:hypothetical protein
VRVEREKGICLMGKGYHLFPSFTDWILFILSSFLAISKQGPGVQCLNSAFSK